MPPRFVYWTILIDGKPTAFRARDREELLPTINQLKRTNQDVVIKWFARGRLWESPEAERAAERRPAFTGEKRTRDWRPGGTHKDPRDRFKKKNRPERAWSDSDRPARSDRDKLGPPSASRPWRDRPVGPPRDRPPVGARPLDSSKPYGGRKPFDGGKPSGDRPWQRKPSGPRADRKPWSGKPSGPPRGDRPSGGKPPGGAAHNDRPWQRKPSGPRADRKPWSGKPSGPPRGDRPWSGKPRDPRRKPFVPRGTPPHRKRRDDDPDKK